MEILRSIPLILVIGDRVAVFHAGQPVDGPRSNSMAEVKEVLPDVPCPMIATFRRIHFRKPA